MGDVIYLFGKTPLAGSPTDAPTLNTSTGLNKKTYSGPKHFKALVEGPLRKEFEKILPRGTSVSYKVAPLISNSQYSEITAPSTPHIFSPEIYRKYCEGQKQAFVEYTRYQERGNSGSEFSLKKRKELIDSIKRACSVNQVGMTKHPDQIVAYNLFEDGILIDPQGLIPGENCEIRNGDLSLKDGEIERLRPQILNAALYFARGMTVPGKEVNTMIREMAHVEYLYSEWSREQDKKIKSKYVHLLKKLLDKNNICKIEMFSKNIYGHYKEYVGQISRAQILNDRIKNSLEILTVFKIFEDSYNHGEDLVNCRPPEGYGKEAAEGDRYTYLLWKYLEAACRKNCESKISRQRCVEELIKLADLADKERCPVWKPLIPKR